MALFKISKGKAKDLPGLAKEGYAWFTTDEGKLYIDIAGDGTTAAEINTNRIPVAEEVAISENNPTGREDLWINKDRDNIYRLFAKNPNNQTTGGWDLINFVQSINGNAPDESNGDLTLPMTAVSIVRWGADD